MKDDSLPETPQATQEINALETMSSLLDSQQVQDAVDAAKVLTPTEEVERSLRDFVSDAFKATNRDLAFNEQLKSEIVRRLPELSDNQLIALFSNANVNLNDKISKLIAPTFQLMTAKQQAEIQASKEAEKLAAQQIGTDNSNDVAGLNPKTFENGDANQTRDTVQGLNALSQLFSALCVQDKPKETNQ